MDITYVCDNHLCETWTSQTQPHVTWTSDIHIMTVLYKCAMILIFYGEFSSFLFLFAPHDDEALARTATTATDG